MMMENGSEFEFDGRGVMVMSWQERGREQREIQI
jgi:hypothetical protein